MFRLQQMTKLSSIVFIFEFASLGGLLLSRHSADQEERQRMEEFCLTVFACSWFLEKPLLILEYYTILKIDFSQGNLLRKEVLQMWDDVPDPAKSRTLLNEQEFIERYRLLTGQLDALSKEEEVLGEKYMELTEKLIDAKFKLRHFSQNPLENFA